MKVRKEPIFVMRPELSSRPRPDFPSDLEAPNRQFLHIGTRAAFSSLAYTKSPIFDHMFWTVRRRKTTFSLLDNRRLKRIFHAWEALAPRAR
jgi:hypothetical protein